MAATFYNFGSKWQDIRLSLNMGNAAFSHEK